MRSASLRRAAARGGAARRKFSTSNTALDADVIVVGGGHAGCEAAAAAARLGASTLLVTQKASSIGEMSCNPSIGGIGKGHLVREVDALGGLMGRCADAAGIHFRLLNRSKGPAVRGPRAQADRDLYRAAVQAEVQSYPNLRVVERAVDDLLFDADGAVAGVVTSVGDWTRDAGGAWVRRVDDSTTLTLRARAVVLTAGTFLRGTVHIGRESRAAGRLVRGGGSGEGLDSEAEAPSVGLAATLERVGLPLARLKTGTPPRLDGTTIDWRHPELVLQPSEEPPAPFSFANAAAGALPLAPRLVDCHRAQTNLRTHAIVTANLHRLPAYEDGENGPRYCPSLHAKVRRFASRDSHGVWLEPEGLTTDLVYPNGLSGAFPLEVQQEIIRSIGGLEGAEIVKPGYDVEYDYVDPRCLRPSLEVRGRAGLYLAGQIIGTTGYEEAAALGTYAGLNAGLGALGRAPFHLGRDEAYVGVLVDDLVGKGTMEPYRMFTSRAEHRLLLRSDNADERLTPRGAEIGCVSEAAVATLAAKQAAIEAGLSALEGARAPAAMWQAAGFVAKARDRHLSARQVLAMPHVELEAVEAAWAAAAEGGGAAAAEGGGAAAAALVTEVAREGVTIRAKYTDYIERQAREVARVKAREGTALPADLVYAEIGGLSNEVVEKLSAARPATLREAGRIDGVTPAAVFLVLQHVSARQVGAGR